jgi:leucyl aminopeptidase
MSVPSLEISTLPAAEITGEVLVLGVRSAPDGPQLLADDAALQDALRSIGATGSPDQLLRVPASGATASIALIGVGGTLDADALRYAAGSALRQLRGVERVVLALPAEDAASLAAVAEGAGLGAYRFDGYKTRSGADERGPASVVVIPSAAADAETVIARARITAEAVHRVRDLVNTPASDLYPENLADRAAELAAVAGVEATVLDEAALEAGGFGGLLGVGRGSARGPRMVRLDWSPAGAAQHIALVGKGITFDTGGLSLKPASSMVGMKYDMTGAASVLAAVLAIAALELPVRVTGWLCLAENMPSGTATRPGDVLTIKDGTTVEVLNTDAEGRLVLADGLVAAAEDQPDAIVDIATLTGAARVALGDRIVGTMGDPDLVAQVLETAEAVGEEFWAMPLPPYLRRKLDSEIADLANAKIGDPAGGMLLAGLFLQEFIGQRADGTPIPWAHLDIAGPANNGVGAYGFTPKGSSGVGVRTLIGLADRLSRGV